MPTVQPMNAGTDLETSVDQAALLRDLITLLAEPLGQVEEILQRELHNDAPFVGELLEYVSGLGGKRMRPCLLLLSGMAAGPLQPAHATLAAVIEMIHTATLIHDDILDGADTRRHATTVNSRWGNQAAVLLGDYLFTHAFFLASTVGPKACHAIGRSTNTVCAGEMKQVGQRGNLDITEAEYFEIIRGKTAELCACCCELGAYYSGAEPQVVEQFRTFGIEVGTAFQIVDDLLDLQENQEQTGKSNGTDLANLKLTLPVIYTLQKLSPQQRDATRETLQTASMDRTTRQELSRLVMDQGGVEYALTAAQRLIDAAMGRLDYLDDSAARRALAAMARFVLVRKT